MPLKEDLVKCFKDTVDIINSNSVLLNSTKEAMGCTNIITNKNNNIIIKNNAVANILVVESTTFNAAKEYVALGQKVAVLNFASAVNPGGGVANGAMAQEECLCRSSNLLPCLKQQHLMKNYYMPHRIANDPMYSDKVIYTENITVFKTDDSVPKLMPSNEWFKVDVITCAAPNLRNSDNIKGFKKRFELFIVLSSRIDMILNTALNHKVDTIILGAWGCGAFKNPPEIVAKAFKKVLDEKYRAAFKNIVFAIKNTNNNNFEMFKRVLDYTPKNIKCDNNKHSFVVKEELTGVTEYICEKCGLTTSTLVVPPPECYRDLNPYIGSTLNGKIITKQWFNKSITSDEFKLWQKDNKYYNKTFSILGDSISTLEGYNPKGYNVFYGEDNCAKSCVKKMEDTWWGKVVDFFGGELLVNNSWSGSRVAKLPNSENIFPSACSDERTSGLHINNIKPDVIIVYLGANDWAKGSELLKNWYENDEHKNWLGTSLLADESCFDISYDTTLRKLKKNYPNSEIWCCTLSSTYMSVNPNFSFPEIHNGNDIKKYNNVIKDCVRENNCNLIDLYANQLPYDSIDGTHPNADGMNILAVQVIREMSDEKGASFLDCKTEHDYICLDGYFDVMVYKCRKCGKEKWENAYRIIDPDWDTYVMENVQKQTNNKRFCSKCGAQLNQNDKFCMKCGTRAVGVEAEQETEAKGSKPITDDIPEIIDDRYKLVRQVGKGASAIVYLAQDIKLNRVCAVKIVKKNTYSNKMAAQESLDEVNKMKLLAHISIPQLYDIYNGEDRLCIVMEFIEGKNLNEIIKSQKNPLDEYTVVSWAKQLCRVLFYLHTLKPPRIFRDLKPANIILQPNGVIKLIDFGTMKNYDESCTEDTVNLGTKGYAAPEQFGGRGQTDARTDIYCLGMTMYHLITGVNPSLPPFEFKSPRYYRKDISNALERIIMKCIEIDRENRYQSAMDLLNELERLS